MIIPFAGKALPYIIDAKTADTAYSGGKLNSEPSETGFNQHHENGKTIHRKNPHKKADSSINQRSLPLPPCIVLYD